MTKKKLILIGGVIVLCLLICLLAVMCSSGGESDAPAAPTGTTGTSSLTYTVEIQSQGGLPLEGIGVYIYADVTMNDLVWFARTDEKGALSFTDIASDNYVAVLSDVPAGYLVEEYYQLTGENTRIVLEPGLMEGDLNTVTYKLGDIMLDFSVTAPDGTVYTLSELLQEKKAVVLNFWYLQCEPCKAEFPYLQEAYEKYSDDVIVLAMNPVNTDNAEIAQFQQDNGYTFVMTACDPAWANAMQLTAYPTTVVIDSYGNICMIHKGSITDAETFETIFSFYSAEDYEQTVVEDMEGLEEASGAVQTVGTKDNPVQMGVTSSFQVTVEPGQLMYYEIYRMTTSLQLTLNNENAYIIYNGKTYYPTNGRISFSVSAEDTSTACCLVFGNSGTETQTYTVSLASAAGSMGNPYSLSLGQFTTNVGAGNETGVWYNYTPSQTGLFTIEVLNVTGGVPYMISVTTTTANGVGSVQRTTVDDGSTNEETGNKTVSINAYAGRNIQISVGTLPDSSNTYPAATFTLKATLEEGKTLDTAYVEKTTYSVNVTDEQGVGVAGVRLTMTLSDSQTQALTTNSDGAASTMQVPTTTDASGNEVAIEYPVILTVPSGYTCRTTEFVLTENCPSLSIKLDTIAKTNYTVKATDQDGKALEGAEVYFIDSATETIVASGVTDANGVFTVSIAQGDYLVSVTKDLYTAESATVSASSTTAEVSMVYDPEGSSKTYTVTVLDYYGKPVPNVKITFKQGGIIRASATTGSDGVAAKNLPVGQYTLASDTYYVYSNATLTEESPSGTIIVVAPLTGDTGNLSGSATRLVYEGASYVDEMQANTSNYLLFKPTEPGVYRVKVIGSAAKLSYWGGNTSYLPSAPYDLGDVSDPDAEDYTGNYSDSSNTWFTVNTKDTGVTHIIGLSGDTDCVLLIDWISDPVTDYTDLPVQPYVPQSSSDPVSFTLNQTGTLKYVDVVNGKTSDYQVVLGEDGYYHLNAADGPLLYVNLGPDMTGNMQLSNFCGVTGDTGNSFFKVVYDSEGNGLYRENYLDLLIAYCECRDEQSGLYPLTYDLMYIIQNGGDQKGWWKTSTVSDTGYDGNYIFYTYGSGDREYYAVNTEIAWMFAVCYFA